MIEVTCPRCGSRVTKRGYQLFGNSPHKRQRYQCTSETCGHTFVPKIDNEQVNADESP